jgi:ectoine hydroxylase-related dioxygenase (phytanoyl-CoA dioxygenase family)
VPLHRDFSIPVKSKVASPNWSVWSVKETVQYGRPPEFVLQSLVAVRVHLEDTNSDNGALEIVPGSHVSGVSCGVRHAYFVPKGGALVLRPLLLHASSKVKSGTRRVLHFVYGPSQLPDGAEWANAI